MRFHLLLLLPFILASVANGLHCVYKKKPPTNTIPRPEELSGWLRLARLADELHIGESLGLEKPIADYSSDLVTDPVLPPSEISEAELKKRAFQDGCRYRMVLFATNRLDLGSGVGRSAELKWGYGLVEFPPDHEAGSSKGMRVAAITPIQAFPDTFPRLSGSIFVYTHGWQNTFSDALVTVAQVAQDIDFDGLAVAWSWPSVTHIFRYGAANDQVAASQPDYIKFLRTIFKKHGQPSNVHHVAHSLGTRLLWRALVEFSKEAMHPHHKFGSVVLAASDLDYSEFETDVAIYGRHPHCRHLYIWSNPHDYALLASEHLVTGNKRLGTQTKHAHYVPTTKRATEAAVASSASAGHSYFASDTRSLHHLALILDPDT